MLNFGSYDTDAVLAQVDRHTLVVLALCALALIGNYIFWIETLRLGWRHRVYAMPAPCIFFFLSHDLTFVASYRLWFGEIDHWFPQLWWYGLVVTCLMELGFLVMWLKFARPEVAPTLGPSAFAVATLAGLVATATAWLVIKSALDDQLYLTIFGFTVFFCGPWYMALTWRRQRAVDQSAAAWLGYLMMPIFYWPAIAILSPTFRGPLWIALGLATVAFGIANLLLVRKLREAGSITGTAPSAPVEAR